MLLRKKYLVFFFICSFATLCYAQNEDFLSEAFVNEETERVKPVNWARFYNLQETPLRTLMGKLLLNANKYALTSWWDQKGFEGTTRQEYLNLRGTTEHKIRPIAAMAQSLAVSLRLNLYNQAVTGVQRAEAEAKTVQLIRTLAHQHRANMGVGGWGRMWQSAMWAGYTAYAGWVMWDKLDKKTKRELVKMIHFECDWVISDKNKKMFKLYRDRSGKIISKGDTGTEENAWDAYMLGLASSMLPESPSYNRWMHKFIVLSLHATAQPKDVNSSEMYHGKALGKWLKGSNINEDGTVINHHFIHPDYLAFDNCAKFFWLADQPVPKSLTLNMEEIFHALADLKFNEGDSIMGRRVRAPGGTIFKDNSSDIFYPVGTDWGEWRRMNFAYLTCKTAVFTKDETIRKRALDWEARFGQFALDMQNRFADGHTYKDKTEDTFPSREEWVADHAASCYLIETMKLLGEPKVTNQRF